MIDLTKFCDPSRTGGATQKPWSHGDYTYAVNGHIAIKVPRRGDVADYDKPADVAKILAQIDVTSEHPYSPMPSYTLPPRALVRCPTCQGHLFVAPCLDCDGEGFHECSRDHCSHEHDCPDCDGNGTVPASKDGKHATPCPECDQEGRKPDERAVHFGGGVGIKAKYLAMIKDLPGFEIALPNIRNDQPIFYRFDGGSGCVMPYRVDLRSDGLVVNESVINADRVAVSETA